MEVKEKISGKKQDFVKEKRGSLAYERQQGDLEDISRTSCPSRRKISPSSLIHTCACKLQDKILVYSVHSKVKSNSLRKK